MMENENMPFDNLPSEVIEEILKRLATCACRNSARLVNKMWLELLNCNTSKDQYAIRGDIGLSNIIPMFHNFQRKRISIHFEEINFSKHEMMKEFWKTVGPRIDSLLFEKCNPDPWTLSQVIEYCNRLKNIVIHDNDTSNTFLRDCYSPTTTNCFVTKVQIAYNRCSGNKVSLLEISEFFHKLFPSLKQLLVTNVFHDVIHKDVYELSKSLKQYNFTISISGCQLWGSKYEVIFNQSATNCNGSTESEPYIVVNRAIEHTEKHNKMKIPYRCYELPVINGFPSLKNVEKKKQTTNNHAQVVSNMDDTYSELKTWKHSNVCSDDHCTTPMCFCMKMAIEHQSWCKMQLQCSGCNICRHIKLLSLGCKYCHKNFKKKNHLNKLIQRHFVKEASQNSEMNKKPFKRSKLKEHSMDRKSNVI